MTFGARIGLGLWVGALVTALFLPSRPTQAADPDRSLVKIGVVNSMFRDKSQALVMLATRPLKNLMEEQLGVKSQIVLGAEAEELGRQLDKSEVQIGVFHGIEFAWARARYPNLKPLIIAVNQEPVLHAVLIVRNDCKATSYADLKGQIISLPKDSREHCRLFLDKRCTPVDVVAKEFYEKVERTRDSEDALDEVFDGDIQAAVVDGIEFEAYQKRKPNRAVKLRALQTSEAFPCAVVAYCPGTLTEEQLKRFREGMADTKNTAQGRSVLTLCRITSFDQVPAEYEQLLTEVLKAYPPEAPK